MLKDDSGLSMVEYILGGALALAIVGLALYSIINSVSAQGGKVKTSVDTMPAQPAW